MEDNHIRKSHNKSLLLYHVVCPSKYRREVFTAEVESTLKLTCQGISERYEINFVEIGSDEDHVHFLVQSVPIYSPKKVVQTIKSITAIRIFELHPEVKRKLWGGKFWRSGYYINTVGQYANSDVIKAYVQNQGKQYKQIHRGQMELF
ncbi:MULTISPECIES: IS200/IS605 family transposase [unclassified Imperialibacter]|uniref:IS200/IS605 family transposase n=1 Tax=unclassified Imperialibacter TaxID=2629706 RepID=UPI0012595657|nr:MULTISPECIES: IS200/IS605 family transposase [unclassified Imperialibacter]CAD5249105.1 transposase [Imperialibacter sp. 89]CAD5264040.1 transposase [Imperialibacter sp. 75]VVT07213.1 transposase [Imperialibacter sp. EC-SDR9]